VLASPLLRAIYINMHREPSRHLVSFYFHSGKEGNNSCCKVCIGRTAGCAPIHERREDSVRGGWDATAYRSHMRDPAWRERVRVGGPVVSRSWRVSHAE
jgi:hypothetical protein